MQLCFFTIPVHGGGVAEDLNRFLSSHRFLSLDRQLVQAGTASAWVVCAAFEPAGDGRAQAGPTMGRRGKVDYREVLNEADFAVYARLRKEIADVEGVPADALFTNEQMAEMVTRRVSSAAALREIPGIGEGRGAR